MIAKTSVSFLNMISKKETMIILIFSATLLVLELDNDVKEKLMYLFKKFLKSYDHLAICVKSMNNSLSKRRKRKLKTNRGEQPYYDKT